MQDDGFDPGEFEHSLATIAGLWAISLVHVGFNRPIHLGPVALHLTLFALAAPFLLAAVNRLRRAAASPDVERPLHAALVAGVLSFVTGILWGRVATLCSLAAMVGAVFMFEGAMHRLTADHAAAALARRWERLRRSTAAAATLFVPAAVLVLGDVALASWLDAVLVVPTAALAAYLLVRLADATRRTRSWLQSLATETSGTT